MTKKILCICNHGNVRSTCMAWLLKNRGHEAISIGIQNGRFDDDSLKTFGDWADTIVDLSDTPEATARLRPFGEKVKKIDIGVDRWFNSMHPELTKIIVQKIPEVLEHTPSAYSELEENEYEKRINGGEQK